MPFALEIIRGFFLKCLFAEKGIHKDSRSFGKFWDPLGLKAFFNELRTDIFEGILQNNQKNYIISGFLRYLNPLKISV